MTTREKSPSGHKLARTNFGVSVRCQCGWSSTTYYGKGARGQALIEWRMHQDGVRSEAAHNSLRSIRSDLAEMADCISGGAS